MSREPAPRKTAAATVSAAPPFVPPAWAIVAALVVLTVLIQRHALHRFLALDDRFLFQ
jgi:hypothetical protein